METASLLLSVLSAILTVLSFIKIDAAKQKHISGLTIVAALLFSLFLGWFIVSQPPHLHPVIIFIGVLLSAVALLICGELILRRAGLRTQMGKLLWLFTILMLVLPSLLFWITWFLLPNQPTNTASDTLQAYCQVLVNNDFARALTYISDSKTQISILSQSDLEQHIRTDEKKAGNLRACISTASDSVTSPGGTSYAGGSIVFSFRPGVWFVKSYSLFQRPAFSTWLIDTEFWQSPRADGVY